ncbi:MAG: MinD/ParA family protein [Acidobacteria bacterium]|nr:MinD/ParA family protein [Acidobacteriota bacterium]
MSLTATAGPRPRATRIAVTSGKGGVGKTSLTINLAVAMARLGHRVGILDADFALGNIDVMLGLTPEQHLGAVLDGVKHVDDVTLEGPSGVRIIPAGSGVRALAALDDERWLRLVSAIDDAGRDLDFLFFDTATGISDNVLDLIRLADYALVVTSYDPAAVVDAYAVIKLISAADAAKPIGVVVNSARDSEEGGLVFRQISLAADRFLGRSIRYDGHVLEDRQIRESVFAQMPLLLGSDAAGPATGCIRRVATRLTAARPTGSGGPWPAPPRRIDHVSPAATMEAPRCA